MVRKSWFYAFFSLGIIVLALGVGIHGLITDTGPVGWLNALQQQFLGSYTAVLSLLAVVTAILVVGFMLLNAVSKILGPDEQAPEDQPAPAGPGQSAEPSPTPETHQGEPDTAQVLAPTAQGRMYFLTAFVLIALTWMVGGALYGWHVMTVREDAIAAYRPLELNNGTSLPALDEKHLALRCIPIPELAVVFKSGAVEDYRLIAVVGLGWEPDQRVHVVAKLEPSNTISKQGTPPDWAPRNPYEVQLLVRRLGPVPTPALQEFQKMRAPLADDVIMVAPVAAKDGSPYLPDTGSDLVFMEGFCGFITLIVVIWATVKWLRRRSALKGEEVP